MAGSNVEAVVNIITEAVRNGRLVPGTRLVEADYTQGLGYSRSTVREAFQRLISSGLLTFERHRGVSVCKLTRKQAIDVYCVRATLEGLGARLATPAAHENAQQFVELQERLDAAVAKSDLSLFSKLNTEFHSKIADAADNDYLLQAIKRFETSIFFGFSFGCSLDKMLFLPPMMITKRLLERSSPETLLLQRRQWCGISLKPATWSKTLTTTTFNQRN